MICHDFPEGESMKCLARTLGLAAILATALALTVQAQTASWPDKPIRFVVPYTPGGGTDTVTRHIAEKITQDVK
jgi:tripartite-type tricarboxylate transporter receptor subunit TctC